jgi:hypothetical protein
MVRRTIARDHRSESCPGTGTAAVSHADQSGALDGKPTRTAGAPVRAEERKRRGSLATATIVTGKAEQPAGRIGQFAGW